MLYFSSKFWRYQIIVVDLQQNSIKRLKEGDKNEYNNSR